MQAEAIAAKKHERNRYKVPLGHLPNEDANWYLNIFPHGAAYSGLPRARQHTSAFIWHDGDHARHTVATIDCLTTGFQTSSAQRFANMAKERGLGYQWLCKNVGASDLTRQKHVEFRVKID